MAKSFATQQNPMSRRADRNDLEARVSELEATLTELREELRPPRGPFGLPRPPRPREFLRFTEQYAVPTAIALLEAQIRMLEGFGAVLRAMNRGRAANERANRTRERAASLGRETLGALDSALSDLETAIGTAGLPDSPAARDLLADAEQLTDEIESELRDVRDTRSRRDAEEIEAEIEILRDEIDDDSSGVDGTGVDGSDDYGGDVDEPPP